MHIVHKAPNDWSFLSYFQFSFFFRLYSNLRMMVPNPEEFYRSQNVIWKKFGFIFTALEGLLTYVEAFKAYYLEALNEFYKDNVQYLEIRALLLEVSTKTIFLYDEQITSGALTSLLTCLQVHVLLQFYSFSLNIAHESVTDTQLPSFSVV